MVIDSQIAHVLAHGGKIEKRYRNSSARQFVNEAQADLRCHDGHAAHFVLHHAFGGFARSSRIVICVTQNRVVAKFSGTRLETLDYFGEKWILDVRNNDAHRTTFARGQVARVDVRKIAEAFNSGEYEGIRA